MLICYGTVGSRTRRGRLWKRKKNEPRLLWLLIEVHQLLSDLWWYQRFHATQMLQVLWWLEAPWWTQCNLHTGNRGCIVYSWCRELVIIVQDIRGVENWQNAQQRFAVMTICHSQYTPKKTDSKNMCRLKLTDSMVANNYFMLLCFVIWLLLLDDVFAVCLRQNKLLSGNECSWVKKNTMVVAHIKHHYTGP
jgi:hypothetical protein